MVKETNELDGTTLLITTENSVYLMRLLTAGELPLLSPCLSDGERQQLAALEAPPPDPPPADMG